MTKSLPFFALSISALLTLSACAEVDGDGSDTTDSTHHGVVCGQTEDGQELFCLNEGSERTYLRNVAYGMTRPEDSASGEWEVFVVARNEGDEACPADGAEPSDPFAFIGNFQVNPETGYIFLPDDVFVEIVQHGVSREAADADAHATILLGHDRPEMCTEDCYQRGGDAPSFRLSVLVYFEGDNIIVSEDAFAGSMDIPHCPELDGTRS